jgi:hypothetical protein
MAINHFWSGFEKQAVNMAKIKNIGQSVLSNIASPFKGAKRIGGAVVRGVENLAGVTENINAGSAGLKASGKALEETAKNWQGAADQIGKSVVQAASTIGEQAGHAAKDISKAVSTISENAALGSKILLGGTVGSLGIYGTSKVLGVPKAMQEYGYYKAQKRLANKQLDLLNQYQQTHQESWPNMRVV